MGLHGTGEVIVIMCGKDIPGNKLFIIMGKKKQNNITIDGLSLRHVSQIVRRKTTTQIKPSKKNTIPRRNKHKDEDLDL